MHRWSQANAWGLHKNHARTLGYTSTHAEDCILGGCPKGWKTLLGNALRTCWKCGQLKRLWTIESSQWPQKGHAALGTLPVAYCLSRVKNDPLRTILKSPTDSGSQWLRPQVTPADMFSNPWNLDLPEIRRFPLLNEAGIIWPFLCVWAPA